MERGRERWRERVGKGERERETYMKGGRATLDSDTGQ